MSASGASTAEAVTRIVSARGKRARSVLGATGATAAGTVDMARRAAPRGHAAPPRRLLAGGAGGDLALPRADEVETLLRVEVAYDLRAHGDRLGVRAEFLVE